MIKFLTGGLCHGVNFLASRHFGEGGSAFRGRSADRLYGYNEDCTGDSVERKQVGR